MTGRCGAAPYGMAVALSAGMGRYLDERLLELWDSSVGPAPEGDDELDELFRRPQPPDRRPERSPFLDPLAEIKRPLRALNGPAPGCVVAEFVPHEIVEIRKKFRASQRQFARMFGISVETLRNWEQGKRRPHGPARSLLRVARAHPEAVARTLTFYRRPWWMD